MFDPALSVEDVEKVRTSPREGMMAVADVLLPASQ